MPRFTTSGGRNWKTEVTQVEFTDEELAAFSSKAGPIHEAWVAEQSANGLPAQELLDMVKKTIAE